MGYARRKPDSFDHHELTWNFDEIVRTQNGCEIIIACNGLWAELIVSHDGYTDTSEVTIDGLYLIAHCDKHQPLYKQSKPLKYSETTAYLFDAVQYQINQDHEKIALTALEARQS